MLVLTFFTNVSDGSQNHPFVNEEIMEVESIKPGMRGYGKTVFSGTKIKRFNVEILGVLKNYDAKSDMILVQLTGPVVEKTGIISGMSGSPVYINGKIIGALSYAWAFAKDPVAGVTPIREMLNILNKDPQLSSNGANHKNSSAIIKASSKTNTYNNTLKPIRTPLMVSGFDKNVFSIMGDKLDSWGMTPFQSGVMGSGISGNIEIEETDLLVPGAAVAAQLVQGDLNAAAIGTVTYRNGNNILAFGHPFMQMGDIDFAMSEAYVHTTLASRSLSAKMASPIRTVGKICQDRKAGIAGKIGEYAKMIPCSAEITGETPILYNFKIVHNDLLTANLCQMAFLSSLLSTEKQLGEVCMELAIKIYIEGRDEPVKLENVYYDPGSGALPIAQITQPINELLNNRFKRVQIEKIDFKARLIDEPKIAFVESLHVDKNDITPGATVNVKAKLRAFDKNCVIEKEIDIQLPDDILPGSKIMITACSSIYSRLLNLERSPEKFKPANFKQLLNLIENRELNNEIFIRVLLPRYGISYKGLQFPSLPPSILSIMTKPNYSGTEMLFNEKIYRIKTDWVINGNQSIFITSEKG